MEITQLEISFSVDALNIAIEGEEEEEEKPIHNEKKMNFHLWQPHSQNWMWTYE